MTIPSPSPAPPSAAPLSSRVRRGISIALSLVTIVAAGCLLVLVIGKPSIFLSDSTYGLSRFEEALVESQAFWFVAATAALILLAGLPRASTRLRQRLPWTLAVVAICTAAATVLVPIATPMLGLLTAVIVMATGG